MVKEFGTQCGRMGTETGDNLGEAALALAAVRSVIGESSDEVCICNDRAAICGRGLEEA